MDQAKTTAKKKKALEKVFQARPLASVGARPSAGIARQILSHRRPRR